MKINIGLNLFEKNERQDLCVESLIVLKKTYPEIINLYNFQFEDEADENENEYANSEIETVYSLKKDSQKMVIGATKKLPVVTEIFNELSKIDGDYFIVTNNDIIISPKYIELIINEDYDCYPTSRQNIKKINSVNEEMSYNDFYFFGFDVFCIKNEWWKKNYHLFPDYFIGMPCWDTDFATIMRLYGNTMFVNKYKPYIFHVSHDSYWLIYNHQPEKKFNEETFSIKNKYRHDIWFRYQEKIMQRRITILQPLKIEQRIENQIFKNTQ